MPRIQYRNINFSAEKLVVIKQAIKIINSRKAQGYDLTLRQVYYRFIALDLFPEDRKYRLVEGKWVRDASGSKNADPNYNWLGCILADARVAGVLDWDSMVDRTREVDGNTHWENPQNAIDAMAKWYLIDTWEGQKYRPEVWVEKDAMEGIVGTICKKLDVQFFSCRGYSSITSLHENAQELKKKVQKGIIPVVFHVGDHDPSGMDMTRNIEEQLRLFMKPFGKHLKFKRLALNMDQVEEFNPPPNPVKLTDKRSKGYSEIYGDSCWELDALDPPELDAIITKAVLKYADAGVLKKMQDRQDKEKLLMKATSKSWKRIAAQLEAEMKGQQVDESQPPPIVKGEDQPAPPDDDTDSYFKPE